VGSCKSSEKIPKSPLNCFGSKLVLTPIDAIQNINERKKEKEKKKRGEFKKENKRANSSYQVSKNTQTQSLRERERIHKHWLSIHSILWKKLVLQLYKTLK
jgi:hypothetical protein